MSSIVPFHSARPVQKLKTSALDRLTAAYAQVHHLHVAPLFGCYLCLHNFPRVRLELASAA